MFSAWFANKYLRTWDNKLKDIFFFCTDYSACFKGAAHGILQADKDLAVAVRDDIMAGGDSCGRCNAIGAAIGAKVGVSGLPKDMVSKSTNAAKAQSLGEQLVALRK